MQISAIICSHNPRPDHLRRSLESLKAQSLSQQHWELLLVDNASAQNLAQNWDLSWHGNARHIREEELGLTPARLRGIAKAEGDLLVFVDTDNVLAADYLEVATRIAETSPHLGVFGAGSLLPEFEAQPAREVERLLRMLALRNVARPLWTNNVEDYHCAPFGAGLCVPRRLALAYVQLVRDLHNSSVLDRKGQELFCGGDDLFSWVSAGPALGFGIFPELRVLHLISADRVRREYFVRLIHGHSFSHAILSYLLKSTEPVPVTLMRWLRLLAHGAKNGRFSMQCKLAEMRGEMRAGQFIRQHQLVPLPLERHPLRGLSSGAIAF
jgi:glycosyltransferase involved in cell wall biosynthesis